MKIKLFNWLFTLMVLVAGLNFASCSEDDEIWGGEEDTPVVDDQPQANPAGDDFYMYVNADWHKQLTNLDTTQGYLYDIVGMLGQKTVECVGDLETVQMLQKSLSQMLNGDQDANLARVKEVIEELLAGIVTKEDAYKAIGKMIGMGLVDEYAQLHMYADGGLMHYTIVPPPTEEEAAASLTAKHINLKKLQKYTSRSRAADNMMGSILEGLGMDTEYFLYEEDIEVFLSNLEKCTLEDLKEFINDMVEAELLLYCGDEYVAEATEGAVKTTADYINLRIPALIGYTLSHQFSKTYVTEALKEKFAEYGEELRAVFAKRIENNAWLSATTKESALAKLEAMKFFYGEPNVWYEEGFPVMKGELLVDDILEAKASKKRLIETLLGKDFREESMTFMMCGPFGEPLNVYNACYVPSSNTMHIYPAIMMAPEYTPDMDPSAMYAAFYVMGHEMTHGFDLEGCNYDGEGYEVNWWTAEDRAKFEILNEQLAKQISTFEVAQGIMANGKQTVTEDVADLGGLNIAFDALNEYLKKNGVSGDKLKEAQKKFFEYHAYRYRTYYTAEALQVQLKDIHSVATVRVNGMVQHMDSWYELYNVTESDALYLPEDKRITIW